MFKIISSDIVDLWKRGKIICITTNGFIKRNGEAVMGRGNALAMKNVVPDLPRKLGSWLRENGNHVGFIDERIIAFPVKPKVCTPENALPQVRHLYKNQHYVPGFHCRADLELVKQSINELNSLISKNNLKEVYLPIPGVGNGGLNFKQIKDVLQNLMNEVILITNITNKRK